MNDYLKKVASFNRESAETSLPQIEKKISEIDTSRMSIDTRARDGTKDKEILDGLDTFGWNDVLDANKSNAFNIRKFIAKIFSWFKAPVTFGDIVRKTEWDGSSIPSSDLLHLYNVIDASQRWIGRVNTRVWSTASGVRDAGAVGALLSARHPTANVENSIQVLVNPDGTKEYTVTDQARFRAAIGITDCVISSGSETASNATWTWRKWASGKIEAWCSYAPSSAVSTTVWSSPVRYKDLTISIPSGVFSSTPGRVYGTSFNEQLWVVRAIGASATSIDCRFATLSSNNVTPNIRFYCVSS